MTKRRQLSAKFKAPLAQEALQGGLCPITRCPKQLMNGPCGGSENGMCEVDTSIPCVWSKIWENSENLDLIDMLMEVQPPKDGSTSRGGGLRRARGRLPQGDGAGVSAQTQFRDEAAAHCVRFQSRRSARKSRIAETVSSGLSSCGK